MRWILPAWAICNFYAADPTARSPNHQPGCLTRILELAGNTCWSVKSIWKPERLLSYDFPESIRVDRSRHCWNFGLVIFLSHNRTISPGNSGSDRVSRGNFSMDGHAAMDETIEMKPLPIS